MSQINKILFVEDIETGSLVFIWHHKKPLKTGWYRLVNHQDEGRIFALEKPMRIDFDPNDKSLERSRKIDNYFVMKESTVTYDRLNNLEVTYEIMASVSGIDTLSLADSNYDLSVAYNLPSIEMTFNFKTLYSLYKSLHVGADMAILASNLI